MPVHMPISENLLECYLTLLLRFNSIRIAIIYTAFLGALYLSNIDVELNIGTPEPCLAYFAGNHSPSAG